MALSILTNTASVSTQRYLTKSQRGMDNALGHLASGLRIVRASDDAAGLAISENLRAQVRSLSVARRNAADGVSMAQTAEGALNETHGMLMRMRELAVQASNGTLSADQRTMINDEFSALSGEIDRISAVTAFNGTNLLDGSTASVDLQVGSNNTADDRITVTLTAADAATLGVDALSATVDTAANAQAAIDAVDSAIDDVSDIRSNFGVTQNRLEATMDRLHAAEENLASAESRIRDADIASETSSFTRGQILMQAGVAMLAQANQLPGMAMSLIGG